MSGALEALVEVSCAPAPLYRKLRPHPNGPSREQVASDQRARIYGAMVEAVAEHGYAATRVRELAGLAGVSTRTFYDCFGGGKHECFLATHDLVIARAVRRILAVQEHERDWRQRLRLAFLAFAGEITREPKAARLVLVEAFAAGPVALERMRRAGAVFETMIAESFARAPDGMSVPPLIVKGIVAGVARVTRAHLLAGRAHELPDLADELAEWALCYRCEATAALRELTLCESCASLVRPGARIEPRSRADYDIDERVREDDRRRILAAVAQLAASEGYWQLSVPHIRTAAGVSRKSFDEHFQDAQDCFMAAVEQLVQRALERAAVEGAAARDWPGGLHRALTALCAQVAHDPVFARLAFVEVFAPGPDGVRCRERVITGVAERLRESAPPAQRPSGLSAEASVGAVWGIVHQHIAAARDPRQLARIAPALSFLTLAPAIGGRDAIEAIEAALHGGTVRAESDASRLAANAR